MSVHAAESSHTAIALTHEPTTASSLLDLRHLSPAQDEYAYDDQGIANGYTPPHHGSHSSVAVSIWKVVFSQKHRGSFFFSLAY